MPLQLKPCKNKDWVFDGTGEVTDLCVLDFSTAWDDDKKENN